MSYSRESRLDKVQAEVIIKRAKEDLEKFGYYEFYTNLDTDYEDGKVYFISIWKNSKILATAGSIEAAVALISGIESLEEMNQRKRS
tara:strand:+ start:497 stop:757 length:261 start_codon:yes stop_codon:yes gene_type:complete